MKFSIMDFFILCAICYLFQIFLEHKQVQIQKTRIMIFVS